MTSRLQLRLENLLNLLKLEFLHFIFVQNSFVVQFAFYSHQFSETFAYTGVIFRQYSLQSLSGFRSIFLEIRKTVQ